MWPKGCVPTLMLMTLHLGVSDRTVEVFPKEFRGPWDGFGTSLCWLGVAIGNSKNADILADAVFTMKTTKLPIGGGETSVPGLGLNIVRYNIGGTGRAGDFPGKTENFSGLVWYKAVEGFQKNLNSVDPASDSWDFSRDANQRAMLKAAADRGVVNKIEFFSNAPMWFMTKQLSSACGSLLGEMKAKFAAYVATVVDYAVKGWGMETQLNSVEIFNEPSGPWWTFGDCKQEGCGLKRSDQVDIVKSLTAELDDRQLGWLKISASDESSFKDGVKTFKQVGPLTDQLNVHAYSGLNPVNYRERAELYRLAAAASKKPSVWMSEYGDNDDSGMTVARSIVADVNYLRASAWIYWQVVENDNDSTSYGWGAIVADFGNSSEDPDRGSIKAVLTKYFMLAQFTRFIRPVNSIFGSNDNNTIVAFDWLANTLSIVTVNYGGQQNITVRLDQFTEVCDTAELTTTTKDGSKLFESSTVAVQQKRISYTANDDSVTTVFMSHVKL